MCKKRYLTVGTLHLPTDLLSHTAIYRRSLKIHIVNSLILSDFSLWDLLTGRSSTTAPPSMSRCMICNGSGQPDVLQTCVSCKVTIHPGQTSDPLSLSHACARVLRRSGDIEARWAILLLPEVCAVQHDSLHQSGWWSRLSHHLYYDLMIIIIVLIINYYYSHQSSYSFYEYDYSSSSFYY
jgi:hypothetical protein